MSRPLYLFSQFFEDKGVEELLGKGVESNLNNDKMGRVVDKMYRFGLNYLFIEIVLLVFNKFEIETKYAHLDSTSFPVDREYKREAKKAASHFCKSTNLGFLIGHYFRLVLLELR